MVEYQGRDVKLGKIGKKVTLKSLKFMLKTQKVM